MLLNNDDLNKVYIRDYVCERRQLRQ